MTVTNDCRLYVRCVTQTVACNGGGVDYGQDLKFPKGLFTWSGGPRSGEVGFFCFHALGDTKQKKLTPLDRGPPLHVNRVLVCVARAGGGGGGAYTRASLREFCYPILD